MRKVGPGGRRFASPQPVALKLNLRFNFNARARRFWVLRRKAEGSQICVLLAEGSKSASRIWKLAIASFQILAHQLI